MLWRKQMRASHLPPVLKEVLPEDLLGCVLVVQHFGKKRGNLFSGSAEFHQLAYKITTTVVQKATKKKDEIKQTEMQLGPPS